MCFSQRNPASGEPIFPHFRRTTLPGSVREESDRHGSSKYGVNGSSWVCRGKSNVCIHSPAHAASVYISLRAVWGGVCADVRVLS